MTKSQQLQLEQSQLRQKINDLLGKEDRSEEESADLDAATKRFQETEIEYRAAVVVEAAEAEEAESRIQSENGMTPERRERLELRSRARLTNYVVAALSGKAITGAELELCQAAGVEGIPLELLDVEQRQDQATGAPGTTGVNLDLIRPAVFARSVLPRLGVEMPMVPSGTYASATITTNLSAGPKAKGAAADASAAGFAVTTASPKRISGRLSVRIEDIAAVGQDNFESALRQNLSLVLSDELDDEGLNGDGSGDRLTGIFQRLTDPTSSTPPSEAADFDDFATQAANGIDGLWAETLKEVAIVVGPATFKLAARTFQSATNYKGEKSAAAYAMEVTGGFWTSKRMPAEDSTSKIQQAILYRMGGMVEPGISRKAVCPHWGDMSIDDIYSGSAKGERYLTMHVLLGDVILVQPNAYEQIRYKVE